MTDSSTASSPAFDLLQHGQWQMVPGERAALEGVLSHLKPALAIEIGTAEGGSLRRLSAHCGEIHSFDLEHRDDLPELPNVQLHSGDSHVLLPEALAEFEREGRNVDFVLVDGDHTTEGARRDVEDLLASGAIRQTVILAHDAANDIVRAGLDAVDYASYGKVVLVDPDFVPGHLSSGGAFANQLWGGFSLIVVDADAPEDAPAGGRPDMHSAFDLMVRAREALSGVPAPGPVATPTVDEPLPPSALPWTEKFARWTSPLTRLRVQMAWERLPRREDLEHPRTYVQGLKLHRDLFHSGHTMTYPLRGRNLFRLARRADRLGVPGALVDCGTWNGGSTALMAAGSPSYRHVWAFDSFEGLPAPSERDVDRELGEEEAAMYVGGCLGSDDLLREAVGRFVPPERLHVCKGWFEDTLPVHAPEIGPIAVLHCDGDWYDSVMLTLDTLYPLVSPGGWIVIDDYGAVPGAGRATDDFRRRVGDSAPLVRVDQTGRYWRKPV